MYNILEYDVMKDSITKRNVKQQPLCIQYTCAIKLPLCSESGFRKINLLCYNYKCIALPAMAIEAHGSGGSDSFDAGDGGGGVGCGQESLDPEDRRWWLRRTGAGKDLKGLEV